MNDWVLIDPSTLVSPQAPEERSDVSFSPYDFPTAVRVIWDERSKTISVDFRYLTEEKTEESVIDNQVTALLGHRTKRLYGLRVKTFGKVEVPPNLAEELGLVLANAFKRLETISPQSERGILSGRYQLAEGALEKNRERLFSSTAH